MKVTCPHCNTSHELEALADDASARELFALLGRLGPAAGPLTAYLGLFKPRVQALRWSRALALATEVRDQAQAAGATPEQLAGALVETVEALREKRQAPGWRPLGGHNYLWRVLESRAARGAEGPVLAGAAPAPGAKSRTAQVVERLRALDPPGEVPEWFARAIHRGLADLVVAGVDGVPAYDVLPELAQQWVVELWPRRQWREDCRFRGAARLALAFRTLRDSRQWPSQRDLLGMVPSV